MNTYKVVFFGDAGCGKTTLVKRLRGLPFDPRYLATIGVEVHPITIGNNCINVWDCAGQEKFKGLADGYFIDANLGVIVLDYETFSSAAVQKYTTVFRRVSSAQLMVIAIRKGDKTINPDDYRLCDFIVSAKEDVMFINYGILKVLGADLSTPMDGSIGTDTSTPINAFIGSTNTFIGSTNAFVGGDDSESEFSCECVKDCHQIIEEITEKLANEMAKNEKIKELIKGFLNGYLDAC